MPGKETDILSGTEARALAYAVESGRAIGYLRSVHGHLSIVADTTFSPEYRLESARRTLERLTGILAEIDPTATGKEISHGTQAQ